MTECKYKCKWDGKAPSYINTYIDIKVEDSVFVYTPFDKRDELSLFIVQMPHLSSNIPSAVSPGSVFSELLWKARCPLRTYDFIVSGRNRTPLTKQLKKNFHCYQNVFQKFGITHEEMKIRIMKNS